MTTNNNTMKTITKILISIFSIPAALWAGSIIYDNHYISKGMPRGFYLECDAAGNYRLYCKYDVEHQLKHPPAN